MKKFYFFLITTCCFNLVITSQNVVTINGSAPWEGFANVFETPANGGGYVFGSGWGVPDLKSTVSAADDTVTLQPNFNTYGDNQGLPPGDPARDFWINPVTGEGNKDFEGNTFVTIFAGDPLFGQPLIFNGNVNSYTLDPGYQAVAFIKVFQNNFAVLREFITVPLIDGEDFLVEFTDPQAGDNAYQYGFFVRGLNANPADEATLGSVVIGVGSDCDGDGILNASDPVDNYTVSGPSNIFIGTSPGSTTCDAFVSYDPVVPSNPCNGSDTFTINQTAGLPSGSNFPVGVTTNIFEVENAAGTMETYSFDVTVSDTTAPALDCPSDFAVSPDDSGSYTILDYSSIAIDNCDADIEIAQDPVAGTIINDGEQQTIIVTATDSSGNESTCSFTITVDATLSNDDIEMDLQNQISLYPNPASQFIQIDSGSIRFEGAALFNMLGAKVLESSQTRLDISNLSPGIYLTRIMTENGILTKKVIIK